MLLHSAFPSVPRCHFEWLGRYLLSIWLLCQSHIVVSRTRPSEGVSTLIPVHVQVVAHRESSPVIIDIRFDIKIISPSRNLKEPMPWSKTRPVVITGAPSASEAILDHPGQRRFVEPGIKAKDVGYTSRPPCI